MTIRSTRPGDGSGRRPPSGSASSTAAAIRSSCSACTTTTSRSGVFTLASAVRLGASFLDPLVFSDPFLVGGADTVRGYPEEGLGPKDFAGRPTGGNAQLILNQEVRTPIYRLAEGRGVRRRRQCVPSNADIALSKLKVGYGVGLRFDTPFSLFRLDFGLPASGGGRGGGTSASARFSRGREQEQGTGNREQGRGNREQGTGNREQVHGAGGSWNRLHREVRHEPTGRMGRGRAAVRPGDCCRTVAGST